MRLAYRKLEGQTGHEAGQNTFTHDDQEAENGVCLENHSTAGIRTGHTIDVDHRTKGSAKKCARSRTEYRRAENDGDQHQGDAETAGCGQNTTQNLQHDHKCHQQGNANHALDLCIFQVKFLLAVPPALRMGCNKIIYNGLPLQIKAIPQEHQDPCFPGHRNPSARIFLPFEAPIVPW